MSAKTMTKFPLKEVFWIIRGCNGKILEGLFPKTSHLKHLIRYLLGMGLLNKRGLKQALIRFLRWALVNLTVHFFLPLVKTVKPYDIALEVCHLSGLGLS